MANIELKWNLTENINQSLKESVAVYGWLLQNRENRNEIFKFVYKNYYRIENAGLTEQWKEKYFTILFSRLKSPEKINLKNICLELYDIKNQKDQNSLQFSFVTKMQNILIPQKPIYDSNVSKVFGYGTLYHIKDISKRIYEFLKRLKEIEATYSSIIKSESSAINKFKKNYDCDNLADEKIVDFVAWQTGKEMFYQVTSVNRGLARKAIPSAMPRRSLSSDVREF
ncbi:MAG: hypothetical protein HQ522_16850 [Bacteroidetes bacterium]|nr:hypothetical protein [Bacteroidota bacterium]